MKNFLWGLSVLILFSAIGCGPRFIKMDSSLWDRSGQKIGLAITEIPKPMAYKTGSQGLLDIAINQAMAGTLETHLATLDVSSIKETLDKLEDEFHKRGQIPLKLGVINYNQLPDFKSSDNTTDYANKDLRTLADKEKSLDAILLIQVIAVGTTRSYYGFIPTSSPAGYVATVNEMVNTADNKLIWRSQTQSTQAVEGDWDEPPDYPNVDKAVSVAIRNLQNVIVIDLFNIK